MSLGCGNTWARSQSFPGALGIFEVPSLALSLIHIFLLAVRLWILLGPIDTLNVPLHRALESSPNNLFMFQFNPWKPNNDFL